MNGEAADGHISPNEATAGVADERPARLRSLDALRGVAALVVMGYHFTRRYGERFDPAWHPSVSYDGQFGVLLFFMISGYVITLTTDRVRRPGEFLFFRFSRLYPTFWVCLAVTATVMHFTRFPAPLPTPASTAASATMLAKSIRRLPHVSKDLPYVDGSYWSLEIELFFYVVIFALLATRQTGRVVGVAIGFAGLSLANALMLRAGRAGLPSVIQWGFFLEYWPYFGIGIAAFAWQRRGQIVGPAVLTTLAAATVAVGGVAHFVTIAVCAAVFGLAVFDRLPPLRWRPLVWLGAVSYPLYLLHQNLGYVMIRFAVGHGVGTDAAIGLAMVAMIGLAAAVSVAVERPTMHALRRVYRRWTHHAATASPVSGMVPAIEVTAADREGA